MALYDGFGYKINFEVASADIDALSGKTILFMGDSYTAQAKSQFAALAEKYGAVADNRGVASSSISGNLEATKGLWPMWDRTAKACDEYISAGTTGNVGAIVFMGGAKDGFGEATWLGTGINDTDTEHIYGAMHSILNNFRKTFPDAPIFVILQPSSFHRVVSTSVTDDDMAQLMGFDDMAQALDMDDYQFSNYAMFKKEKVVQEVAEFYGCHIVDCCFDFYNVMNENDRATYWSGDKLHMTSAGYQAVADKLETKMIEVFG